MKITHNKVGQNLNMIDGVKQEKTGNAKSVKDSVKELATPAGNAQASRVDVSDRAQEAKQIKEMAIGSSPDVDMDKVEKFRRLIDAGQYKVDAKAVADRMVDEHLESKF